jgi:peptidoglycan/xylan/chitin deacetylase (PgdA/CDA1 family)
MLVSSLWGSPVELHKPAHLLLHCTASQRPSYRQRIPNLLDYKCRQRHTLVVLQDIAVVLVWKIFETLPPLMIGTYGTR